jgi:hypothetical protein
VRLIRAIRSSSFLSAGPHAFRAMVSRRKILSRSRDELNSDIYYMAENDDDDVWYSKDKLYAVCTNRFQLRRF